MVSICTPNNVHAEIAISALNAGKHVLCEKPIASTLEDAKAMAEAAKKAAQKGIIAMNAYQYRRVPAIDLAKKFIDEGSIGKILNVRCTYLQSWSADPASPLSWRFQKDIAGAGTLGDIASHVIDIAQYLAGNIEAVTGMMQTYITERPVQEGGTDLLGTVKLGADAKRKAVDVDDEDSFLVKFKNGAVGSIEATRNAWGRNNFITVELHGTLGSLYFNYERLNELQVCLAGDPDAGNMPRVDPETGNGIITDVCLKRKIRNYVQDVKENESGWRIYIKDQVPLNRSDLEAGEALGVGEELAEIQKGKDAKKIVTKLRSNDPDIDLKLRDFMCSEFFDIRTFGAVMTTFVKGALNCGQVRGPVQLGFARSIDPIVPQEVTITRTAITTESDAQNKTTEMGRKYVVPYGLYRAEGFVSANLARRVTGFSEEDLQMLWQAILNMFENDHSAARGKMAVRELIIFKHASELGNAASYKLFDAVTVKKVDGVAVPRKFSDYTVTVSEDLPEGVTCERLS